MVRVWIRITVRIKGFYPQCGSLVWSRKGMGAGLEETPPQSCLVPGVEQGKPYCLVVYWH